jgi:uncharacterized protein (DUF433 family)
VIAAYDSLTAPRYSFAETDRLAGVSRGTSKRWLTGYTYWYAPGELRASPPVNPEGEHHGGAAFIDLMEIVVIGGLRRKGFSLPTIRRINEFCQVYLHSTRPLVTEKFKVDGRDAFMVAGSMHLVNVNAKAGMLAWSEVLDPFLENVDFENELARRWWPCGREEPVVLDPDYGFGLPVIHGTSVRTEIVAERALAGDSAGEIAYDFGLGHHQIDSALRYEGVSLAA